jgi:DNA (cytosine-5)-methyltransferase 1
MKHYGDITKINGANVEPVDAIIGGSPCQDLSVAGKRAGLAGARSGLFMEQIRIIKEMRSKTNGKYPRFMVWENVPGAFSSNKGEDFRAVLEETARIADETAVIPRPPKGKWQTVGCIMGDGWSIAWRVFDAQFWGVPQRRRRIALVADFGGESAPEILFERESVSGDIAESGAQGEGIAGGIESDTGTSSGDLICLNDQGGSVMSVTEGITSTLRAEEHGHQPCVMQPSGTAQVPNVYCIQGNCIDRADTAGCNGKGWTEDVSYTLNTVDRPAVYAIGNGQADQTRLSDKVGALNCMHDQQAVMVTEPRSQDGVCRIYHDTTPTLNTAGGGQRQPCVLQPNCYTQGGFAEYIEGVGTVRANGGDYGGGSENLISNANAVRRLTPLECERLQGFPDGWTDIGDWVDTKGKKHKTTDSNRYKALGNSIALPSWHWLLNRLSQQFTYTPTMASLFDGIGGFPLIWERINGKGTAVWASEIDEFAIAVTRLRFGNQPRKDEL